MADDSKALTGDHGEAAPEEDNRSEEGEALEESSGAAVAEEVGGGEGEAGSGTGADEGGAGDDDPVGDNGSEERGSVVAVAADDDDEVSTAMKADASGGADGSSADKHDKGGSGEGCADVVAVADAVMDSIPPSMIESSTSLTDVEKSPLPGVGQAITKQQQQRGEKRPAASEATPPTPPLTEKPPTPKQKQPPEGLDAGGKGKERMPAANAAGKQRRAQRQKQKQRVNGPAGAAAGGAAQQPGGPRRVQQRRRAAPQQPQQPAAAQQQRQQQQQPQQRVVLGVPSWLGSTFSAYTGSINRRTAMALLGVTAVVGASIGSVIAMGGGAHGGSESGVRGGTTGTSSARGGGMAARTSAHGSTTFAEPTSNIEPVLSSDILVLNGAAPAADTPLPAAFDAYAEFGSPRVEGELAFFLHVPRSGGLTVMEILGKCLDLVVAGAEAGASKGGHEFDKELLVIETPSGSYVNCDPTTPLGIERCQTLDLVNSGLADVVSSPLPYEASSLFAPPDRRGRMFALLRPVVDRAVSHFRWIQVSGTDPYITMGMDLAQYVRLPTDRPEFNWLTKALAGKPGTTTDILTLDDLNVAKEVLRRKAVVGLLSRKGDSMLRFERTFGWDRILSASPERKRCEEETLHWEWKGKAEQSSSHSALSRGEWAPGTELHTALERRNAFDVELYRYAERLFEEQMAAFDPNASAGTYNQQEQQQPSLESSAPAVPLSDDVSAMTASNKRSKDSLDDLFQASATVSSSTGSSDFCRKELLLSAALAAMAAADL